MIESREIIEDEAAIKRRKYECFSILDIIVPHKKSEILNLKLRQFLMKI